MISNSTQEKITNFILSLLVVVGVFAVLAYFFDFFYDINDDMVIKDILSGAYSGTPDGHTNQMLYPLGLALSMIYRILPGFPVFSLFLCGCFGLCFCMIANRVLEFFKKDNVKIVTILLLVLIFLSLMVWELIYVQYSVVCGVLAGTACFWFYTTSFESSVGEFWKKNIPALLLVWLAFLVRSEMLLLTCPFIAVVGICHWAEATKIEIENYTDVGQKKIWKHVLSKNNLWKYIGFVVVLLIGMGAALGGDYLAYRSEGWQDFRGFFDARTDVYDYTWYPNYEEQQAFYEENGISEIQYLLIDNYNFGLDEDITDNTLETIASYGERPKLYGSVQSRMKYAFVDLIKRTFSLQDAPYNYFVLAGYGLVVGLAVIQKEKKYIWKLILLLIMRCIPWMYMIYVQRAVARVIHPLYVVEFLILLAILVKELHDRPLWNVEKYYRMVAAGVLATIAIISLPFGFMKAEAEQNRREQVMVNQQLLDSYAKSNPENFYFLDVYSTVNFVEKMFEDVDNSRKNYDLLGGWICKSPLQKEAFGDYTEAETIEDAFLTENIYFVAEKNQDVTFMEDYYKTKGKNIRLEEIETVGEGENPFVVYSVSEKTNVNKKVGKKTIKN